MELNFVVVIQHPKNSCFSQQHHVSHSCGRVAELSIIVVLSICQALCHLVFVIRNQFVSTRGTQQNFIIVVIIVMVNRIRLGSRVIAYGLQLMHKCRYTTDHEYWLFFLTEQHLFIKMLLPNSMYHLDTEFATMQAGLH